MPADDVEYIALDPKPKWNYGEDELNHSHSVTRLSHNENDVKKDGEETSGERESWILRLSGCNTAILWIILLTAIITTINIVLAVTLMSVYPVEPGIGDALVGSCSEVASWSRWLHIGWHQRAELCSTRRLELLHAETLRADAY
jgi:hypothetical protein